MPAATAHRYLIALGSNQRHARFGAPRRVLAAALERLEREGVRVIAAAAVIETDLEPEALLPLLKRIERQFGRRPGGRRWRARVLDLDVVLWSGGIYPPPVGPSSQLRFQGRGLSNRASDALTIPHPLFRTRDFVLTPAATIAPTWRDPVTGRTLRQLRARLTAPRAQPKRAAGRALSSVGRATDF